MADKLCSCGKAFAPNGNQKCCNDCRFTRLPAKSRTTKPRAIVNNQDKSWRSFEGVRQWRAIPGYEGRYEISDHGDILSLVKGRRILRPSLFGQGYKTVLSNRRGERRWHTVQRLMLMTFCPLADAPLYIAAPKGDAHDMRLQNWQWKRQIGEHSNRAKLTATQVKAIKTRLMADNTLSYRAIAKEYCVSMSAISHIMTGENWAHVS